MVASSDRGIVGMRARITTFALLVLVLVSPPAAVGSAERFPKPPSLRPAVEFWKKVFAVWSEHQIAIHDTEHLGRVYSVLDFREQAAAGESKLILELSKKAAVENEKARIRGILMRLDARAGNDGGLDAEERKIWNLFASKDGRPRFAAATAPDRLRAQPGLKERFARGVRMSRRYLAEMEEIFATEGLPTELTRLPLVESCFDISAYSKVGAAGIWQFMPATGRSYMTIGGVVDERRDPLRATRGAARHLRENYEALGSWPLAITAYNHGRYGMHRAVRETGTTDIGQIVRRYRGPLFGFASRNFYAEFLAAIEVEANHKEHFGELEFDAPFRGDEVMLRSALSGSAAASCADVSPEELALLNPAVDSAVFRGRANLPRGYLLRVPHGSAGAFQQRLAQIASDARVVAVSEPKRRVASSKRGARASRAASSYRTHKVRSGQTLSQIASRYGVSVRRLKSANGLRGSVVRAGQVLRIPTG
jgi:membrane-bound lytic murein transglycosylase D